MQNLDTFARIVLIGIGATALMDVWLFVRKRFGVPVQSFALLGRWIGHWRHGVWRHQAIAGAAPVRGETAIGWLAHYAIGIAFAALAVLAWGPAWTDAPSPGPALLTGLATVAAPLLVLQPVMGAGIASTRTAAPLRNSLRSLTNHMAFGWGLYFAAAAVHAAGG